jgi:hypothetical protein
MNFRPGDASPLPVKLTASPREFPHEVPPLMGDLPVCDGYPGNPAHRASLAAVEAVTAPVRLGMNLGEVSIDGGTRRCMSAEAPQLRMVAIALRSSAQNGLREQGFAPKGDQTLRIKVTGVKGPEAHGLDRLQFPVLPAARGRLHQTA